MTAPVLTSFDATLEVLDVSDTEIVEIYGEGGELNRSQIAFDMKDPGSEIGVALKDAINAEPSMSPTGLWDFSQNPTVAGVPIGQGTGTVKSVNTQTPDGAGNVALTADNVPETATRAYPTPGDRDKLAAATAANTASAIVKRDAGGNINISDPTVNTHAGTKAYIDKGDGLQTPNTISANYTLVNTDAGRNISVTATATITIPTQVNANIPAGALIKVIQATSGGIVSFAAQTGVSLRTPDGRIAQTNGQYAVVWLLHTTGDNWYLFGDGLAYGATPNASFLELLQDQVNAMLTAGTGINLTYDDVGGTLIIENTGSTGGVNDAPAGAVFSVVQNSDGTWPNRLTSRTDIRIIWIRVVAESGNPPSATSPALTGAYPKDMVVGA